MWKVIREIAKGSSLYYRQLNLFLLIALVISCFITLRYVPKHLLSSIQLPNRSIDASVVIPETNEATDGRQVTNFDIVVDKAGRVKVNGQQTHDILRFGREKDDFLFIVVSDPTDFVDAVRATVHLPYDVEDFDTIDRRIYAIHGVGTYRTRDINKRTVVFEAESIPPGGEVSIGFTFPKNYFSLSPVDKFRSQLSVLSSTQWILIGSVLPSLSGILLLYLLVKKTLAQWRVRNRMPLNIPPSSAPPALIGALYRGYIGKKEITATLFDLARRGFITVYVGEEDEIVFAKGGSLFSPKANMLRPYEIFLLHQIFGDEEFASHGKDIKVGLNSELFSSKIALTILNIYDATVAEGYFIKSPNTYFLRYKTLGLLLFFMGLLALVYGAFALPEPAYILFGWLGMIIAALIIIKITPGLPTRTRMGDKTLRQWMGFRNYLTAKQPIEALNSSDFFTSLPYAIVMDCEKEWIARWKEQPIKFPEWFTAQQDLYTAEEFSQSVMAIIDFLAKHLIAARPPDLA